MVSLLDEGRVLGFNNFVAISKAIHKLHNEHFTYSCEIWPVPWTMTTIMQLMEI